LSLSSICGGVFGIASHGFLKKIVISDIIYQDITWNFDEMPDISGKEKTRDFVGY